MQELARYWANDYDFGRLEARLNAFPHFVTEIDGVDIHFIHVRSPHENALPVIITHGWPGSIVEMLNVIGPLTDPTAHGGDARDAFDVVVPSMPGYGFSGKPTGTGWGPVKIADAWFVLMKRLGYDALRGARRRLGRPDHRHDGCEGTAGAHRHPLQHARHRSGCHRQGTRVERPRRRHPPSGLSADEQRAYDRLNFLYTKGLGYGIEMGNRPQTLYGLADSPVALAAWMLDHDLYSYEDIASAFRGEPVGNLTRDEVLDNITLTWVTNTGVSSGRLYWENTLDFFDAKGVTVPAAVSVFPRELYQAPRSWTEQAYPNLIYFNELDRGNHFAAWQEPELFTTEVRAAFRSLR